MKRNSAAAIAADTLMNISDRFYESNGIKHDLSIAFEYMISNTVDYHPNNSVSLSNNTASYETTFAVHNESTLVSIERLARAGYNPCALNFASAKHPGGGFIRGAVAQEEVICRSSALYESIRHSEMYAYHARKPNPFYSDFAIYSPNVPVWKNDNGAYLETPYLCSFVTCPAVNAGVVAEQRYDEVDEIGPRMAERTERVLAIMAEKGHNTLVLGAWGCGVFRNNPVEIAEIFRDQFKNMFAGVFKRVEFAVLDNTREQANFRAFAELFGVN